MTQDSMTTVLNSAAQELRESAHQHKLASAAHRAQAKACWKSIDRLKVLAEENGINLTLVASTTKKGGD